MSAAAASLVKRHSPYQGTYYLALLLSGTPIQACPIQAYLHFTDADNSLMQTGTIDVGISEPRQIIRWCTAMQGLAGALHDHVMMMVMMQAQKWRSG